MDFEFFLESLSSCIGPCSRSLLVIDSSLPNTIQIGANTDVLIRATEHCVSDTHKIQLMLLRKLTNSWRVAVRRTTLITLLTIQNLSLWSNNMPHTHRARLLARQTLINLKHIFVPRLLHTLKQHSLAIHLDDFKGIQSFAVRLCECEFSSHLSMLQAKTLASLVVSYVLREHKFLSINNANQTASSSKFTNEKNKYISSTNMKFSTHTHTHNYIHLVLRNNASVTHSLLLDGIVIDDVEYTSALPFHKMKKFSCIIFAVASESGDNHDDDDDDGDFDDHNAQVYQCELSNSSAAHNFISFEDCLFESLMSGVRDAGISLVMLVGQAPPKLIHWALMYNIILIHGVTRQHADRFAMPFLPLTRQFQDNFADYAIRCESCESLLLPPAKFSVHIQLENTPIQRYKQCSSSIKMNSSSCSLREYSSLFPVQTLIVCAQTIGLAKTYASKIRSCATMIRQWLREAKESSDQCARVVMGGGMPEMTIARLLSENTSDPTNVTKYLSAAFMSIVSSIHFNATSWSTSPPSKTRIQKRKTLLALSTLCQTTDIFGVGVAVKGSQVLLGSYLDVVCEPLFTSSMMTINVIDALIMMLRLHHFPIAVTSTT